MSVVTGALASLIPKLAQLLHGEYKLQKGVREQVEWLHRELERIHAFLQKVGDVPWDRLDEQVKLWAREVREATYDMEDVLDTYLVRIDGAGPTDWNRLKRAMEKIWMVFTKAKARRNIAVALTGIKKILEEIAKTHQYYKIDDIVCKQLPPLLTIDPRIREMNQEVTRLVGVNKSSEDFISLLNHSQPDDDALEKKNIKKVSIVGVGGLGKTTLAKVVYDKLRPGYDCGAFVPVGRDSNPVKVLKNILYGLDNQKFMDIHNSGKDVQVLVGDLGLFLQNKRYFVVIDDLWELNTWKIIKKALVGNNCGSKVITTTRNYEVAEKVGDEVYKLNPLSNDDSMNLFCTRISGADRKYLDNQPDDIFEKILKKCSGIPLAIISMASLLDSKAKHQWSVVFNAIGFVHDEDNSDFKDTMTILSFSYYDLPAPLRTCLLYLSTYPEDYEIEKDSLIWKWIAEGFIVQKQGSTLFEVGERYFSDLINRCLIQAVETSWDGRVLGCRIHDMVLDMIRKIALQENFIALLGDNVEGTSAPSSVRRLNQHNIRAEHKNSEATVAKMTKVRSYSTFLCSLQNQDQFLRFKILHVLDIVDCRFEKGCHLDHLGDLVHLRYLGIRRCRGIGSELPKQIENLKLLQTIDVEAAVPESIVQLTKLLRLRGGLMDTQDGIGNLTSLQELIIIISYGQNRGIPKRVLKELGRLVELRVLEFRIQSNLLIWDKSMQRYFVDTLCNLKKIKHIAVNGYTPCADTAIWEEARFVLPESLCYLRLPFIFSRMPSCIDLTRLPCLSYLSLWVLHMDEHDLRLLAKLPELCYLSLGRTESTVTASNINDGDGGFFQKLRYFYMWSSTMVQFEQPNEKDASISFHMWNGKDAMPLVPRKSSDSKAVVPHGVMPNLEELGFRIPFQAIKDNDGDCVGSFGLEYVPSLRELSGQIDCDGVCSEEEVDAALAALENACKAHPNNPTLRMTKINHSHLRVHQKIKENYHDDDLETASADDFA